jgi:hypothetical protein
VLLENVGQLRESDIPHVAGGSERPKIDLALKLATGDDHLSGEVLSRRSLS